MPGCISVYVNAFQVKESNNLGGWFQTSFNEWCKRENNAVFSLAISRLRLSIQGDVSINPYCWSLRLCYWRASQRSGQTWCSASSVGDLSCAWRILSRSCAQCRIRSRWAIARNRTTLACRSQWTTTSCQWGTPFFRGSWLWVPSLTWPAPSVSAYLGQHSRDR